MNRVDPPSWLARLTFTLIAILTLVGAVVLSAVFLALFFVLALIGGGWLWWQQRHLRRQAKKQQKDFIQVEYEVLEEEHSLESETDNERPRR